MSWLEKMWSKVTGTEKIKVRARNKKGHYVGDDKSTPDVNEAWTTKRVKKSKQS
jgi:anion-transporting  ArsA/GET3 family ATPase